MTTAFEGDEPWSQGEERLWDYGIDFDPQNRGLVLNTWKMYVQR